MTNKEPITLEVSSSHCYLKTGEFSNDARCNLFKTGTITYDDYYERPQDVTGPLIKVIYI